MRRTCLVLMLCVGGVVSSLAAALPPLTDPQQAQLATAEDGSPRLDDGAWYPLIDNALAWPAGVEAGATVPDYDAIARRPADHRGDLFLIEGTLARTRRFGLIRTGPWGDALSEWVVIVRPRGDDPDMQPEEVAVVYLVDPRGELPDVQPGRRVRLVARFYKLWGDLDQTGAAATYMTFVGRGARVIDPPVRGDTGYNPLALLIPLVALLLVGYVIVRRAIRPAHLQRGSATASADAAAAPPPAPAEPDADAPPPLPRDPAEALEALDFRKPG